MPSLRKLSLESTRAIARNPNIDLKVSVHLLKPDKQYLIRTPQFQKLLTKFNTI